MITFTDEAFVFPVCSTCKHFVKYMVTLMDPASLKCLDSHFRVHRIPHRKLASTGVVCASNVYV